MRRAALTLTALACALSCVLTAPPAGAQARGEVASVGSFTDSRRDVPGGIDLRRVRVSNGTTLRVTLHHRDIRRRAFGNFFSVFVDTSTAHPGPDFAIVGGLSDGTDWSTRRATRNWRTYGSPVGPIGTCRSTVDISWRDDVVRIGLGRDCLDGHQGRVRVSVVVGDGADTDYGPRQKRFYRWLPRG